MKKYIKLVFVAILYLSATSCLELGLEDLPEFDLNDINSVQRVEYRFVSDEISPADGEKIVKFVTLDNSATIEEEIGKVSIEVTVPDADASFPEAERANCSQSNISVMVAISTASVISPVGNAPILGVPGDWSVANMYTVTAADGSKKEWTIEVTSFTK